MVVRNLRRDFLRDERGLMSPAPGEYPPVPIPTTGVPPPWVPRGSPEAAEGHGGGLVEVERGAEIRLILCGEVAGMKVERVRRELLCGDTEDTEGAGWGVVCDWPPFGEVPGGEGCGDPGGRRWDIRTGVRRD